MPTTNVARHIIVRSRSRVAYQLSQRSYSTDPGKAQRTVQTPLQSLQTDQVAPIPLKPEAESTQVQTPIQSQNAAAVTPSVTRPSKQKPSNFGPISTLLIGLLAVPAVSYGYYVYRKEHMEKKWEGMLREAQQKQPRG